MRRKDAGVPWGLTSVRDGSPGSKGYLASRCLNAVSRPVARLPWPVMAFAVAHKPPRTAEEGRALADAGVAVVEVDVRLIAGTAVVSHWLPLHRLLPWPLHDGWRFHWGLGHPDGRSVAEALDLVVPGQRVMLDLKDDAEPAAGRLARHVASQLADRQDRDRFVACSHHWPGLDPLREVGVETWRTVGSPAALRRALRSRSPHAGHAVRHTLLTGSVVGRLREYGEVVAWTVNDVGRAEVLVRRGVTGVTSDRAEVFRAVSGGRAKWAGPGAR